MTATNGKQTAFIFTHRPILPHVALSDPDVVLQNIQTYFYETLPHGPSTPNPDGNHPTPDGLAQALGIASFHIMKRALDLDAASAAAAATPLESKQYVYAACATLQDYYTKHSLNLRLPHSVTKFIASAYFDINETKQQNTHTTSDSTKRITITIAGSEPITDEDTVEMKRLTDRLNEQTSAELAQINPELAALL